MSERCLKIARLGYTRFWPSILYQYYTGGNYYYTIQYLYQYYTNFIGGFVHRCVYSSKKIKLKNIKGIKTFPLHTQHEVMFNRYAKLTFFDGGKDMDVSEANIFVSKAYGPEILVKY